jgi:hypothetical protein
MEWRKSIHDVDENAEKLLAETIRDMHFGRSKCR